MTQETTNYTVDCLQKKKNLPSFEEEVSARRVYPAIQTLDVRL